MNLLQKSAIPLALTALAALTAGIGVAAGAQGFTLRTTMVVGIFALGGLFAAAAVTIMRRVPFIARFVPPVMAAAAFLMLHIIASGGLFFIDVVLRNPEPPTYLLSLDHLGEIYYAIKSSFGIFWLFGVRLLWPWGMAALFAAAWALWRIESARDH